jgi:hypothetical protein
MGKFRYEKIELDSEKNFRKAERLHYKGYKFESSTINNTITFEIPITTGKTGKGGKVYNGG